VDVVRTVVENPHHFLSMSTLLFVQPTGYYCTT
jgi:hypothetical protein